MITGHDQDTVTNSGSSRTTYGHLRQNIEDGSSELKKARYSWEVKNKTLNFINGKADLDVLVTKKQDFLKKSLNLSESCKSCCSYPLQNGCIKSGETLNCSSIEINEIKTSQCDSCHVQSEHNEATKLNTAINGACAQNGCHCQDPQDSAFTYKLDSSKNGASSQILLHSQLSEKQSHECSSGFSSVQGVVTMSVEPAEPLDYAAMPIGTWLQEYGVMHAELDNHINKALEHLRHLADCSAQRTQQAYLTKRISLETAGIFQVIEQQGLRTCSSNVSNVNPKLGSYDNSLRSDVTGFVTSLTSIQENCDTNSVQKYICENSIENEPEVTLISSSTMAEQTLASVLFCPEMSAETFWSSDSTAVSNSLSLSPTSSFIIDQAVSAVICERGIHL